MAIYRGAEEIDSMCACRIIINDEAKSIVVTKGNSARPVSVA